MDDQTLAKLLASYPVQSHGDDGMTVITCPARLSFVHFDKPHAMKGATKDPRFSCLIILPVAANLGPLIAAAQIAWAGSPLRDKAPKMMPFKKQSEMLAKGYDGFGETGFYINAETKTNPDLFDIAMQSAPADAFYSGVWARVKVRASAYDVSGNNGVKFWLQGVQKFADDTKFSGGSSADGFSAAGASAPAGNGAAKAPLSAAAAFGLPV